MEKDRGHGGAVDGRLCFLRGLPSALFLAMLPVFARVGGKSKPRASGLCSLEWKVKDLRLFLTTPAHARL
jgi:hypothetical protein